MKWTKREQMNEQITDFTEEAFRNMLQYNKIQSNGTFQTT